MIAERGYAAFLGQTQVLTLPWLGGRPVQTRQGQMYRIEGPLPPTRGWWRVQIRGRVATVLPDESAASAPELPPVEDHRALSRVLLAHGRRVSYEYAARVARGPVPVAEALALCPEVPLLPEEVRTRPVASVRVVHWGNATSGAYIFAEDLFDACSEVQRAFEDGHDDFSGATPVMRAAIQLLRRLREAEAAAQAAQAQRQLMEQTGSAAGRRALAQVDFAAAARAALQLGGADLLDARAEPGTTAWIVRWRWQGLRLECTVNEAMHVLDAGICLTDHDTGESFDRVLSLESLPSVVAEAERLGRLHVWRRG